MSRSREVFFLMILFFVVMSNFALLFILRFKIRAAESNNFWKMAKLFFIAPATLFYFTTTNAVL